MFPVSLCQVEEYRFIFFPPQVSDKHNLPLSHTFTTLTNTEHPCGHLLHLIQVTIKVGEHFRLLNQTLFYSHSFKGFLAHHCQTGSYIPLVLLWQTWQLIIFHICFKEVLELLCQSVSYLFKFQYQSLKWIQHLSHQTLIRLTQALLM